MKTCLPCLGLLILIFGPLSGAETSKPEPQASQAQESTPEEAEAMTQTIGPDLEGILRLTLTENKEIEEARAQVEVARSQLERAKAAGYPQAQAMMLLAPAFEERGNALASTPNYSKWGPVAQVGAQIIQPIYTFGQLSGYKEAANYQILAMENLRGAKANEMVRLAKELYFGFEMARDLHRLVESTVSFLQEAVEKADAQLKKKNGSIKQHDVFLLKTTLSDLTQKGLLASQSMKTASQAVSWISGTAFDALPEKGRLEPLPYTKKTLEEYLQMALASRPEVGALNSGIRARQALSEAKRAQSYPVLFVGGFFSQAWSGVHDEQKSIYVSDPFNGTRGGLGVGLKFDLEFSRHAAEAQEESAERMKLEAKKGYAVPGIELQVKKAFWELEQAEEGLKLAKERRKTAKKWFISSGMGWSVGVTPARDLMESLKGDAEAKQNYIETVYALNLALGNLSLAVGKEVSDLKYQ